VGDTLVVIAVLVVERLLQTPVSDAFPPCRVGGCKAVTLDPEDAGRTLKACIAGTVSTVV